LKTRYSIESYEKLLIEVQELRKSHENMHKSQEKMKESYEERLARLEEDRLNDNESHSKAA
jgi:hypothetical protein